MGRASGSRECAPDDRLRETHRLHGRSGELIYVNAGYVARSTLASKPHHAPKGLRLQFALMSS
jgi:hypothetical protein